MVSVFNPVSSCSCSPILSSYMGPITGEYEDGYYASIGIPAGTFGSFNLQTCKAISKDPKVFPIVLFSPGSGNSRLSHNLMAQQVASTGYTVITIDHPYDANIVTFPDNSTILGIDIEDNNFAADVRARDISFVIDQLAISSVAKKLIPGLKCGLDVSKVAIFGHSLGGAAAAQAMLNDSRIIGGINLDGSFWSTVINKGLSKPFLVFAHEGKNLTSDPSWEAIWPKFTGWKRLYELAGSAHGTFTDFPSLVAALGFEGQLGDAGAELLGTIGGARAMDIITTYVTAFMDSVLKGKRSGLLNGKDVFPEVSLEEK